MLTDEGESLTQGLQILQQIRSHPSHHFIEQITGIETLSLCKTSQQGHIHWRVELAYDVTANTQPLGRPTCPPGIEPLCGLEPVTEHFCVLVEPEVLKHKGKRTDRIVIARELVMIKIPSLGLMLSTHIDHQHSFVIEVSLLGLTPLDGSPVLCHQQAAGQVVVFVRAPRVRKNQFDGHERRDGRELRPESKPSRQAGCQREC